jgi:hypothetical protein
MIRISVDGETVIDCAVANAEARWANALASALDDRAA